MTSKGDTLVIGYGNPGRVDDGLGPAFAERIEGAGLAGVRVLSDYQLQVEHACEVAEAAVVLFADASTSGDELVSLRRLLPRQAEGIGSHSLRPETVIAFARDMFGWDGQAYLLGIRGADYNRFAEELSTTGMAALEQAVALVAGALRDDRLEASVTDGPTDNTGTLCQEDIPCKITSM